MTHRILLTVTLVTCFFDSTLAEGNISCLVMRPGFGLVSEECPPTAIGCRIKASKELIEWYELSRLYDRNQLVCVYPEEYKTTTGCMRKPSGSVRCWCGGRSDCNDPETSRDLHRAFTSGNNAEVEKIAVWIKNSKKGDVRPTEVISTTTSSATTTTPKPTVATTPIRPKIVKTTTTRKATRLMTTTTSAVTSKTLPSLETLALDPIFDEARKKLEEEMKEEDDRLKQMLADEENELSDLNMDLTAEDQRELEREKYRMERRRAEQRQEDDILKRMEEEEMMAGDDDDEEAEEEKPRGATWQNTSSVMTGLPSFMFLLIFVLY